MELTISLRGKLLMKGNIFTLHNIDSTARSTPLKLVSIHTCQIKLIIWPGTRLLFSFTHEGNFFISTYIFYWKRFVWSDTIKLDLIVEIEFSIWIPSKKKKKKSIPFLKELPPVKISYIISLNAQEPIICMKICP